MRLAQDLLQSVRARVPPNIALVRLLRSAETPEQALLAIDNALRMDKSELDPHGRALMAQIMDFWRRNPGAWSLVRNIGAGHGVAHSSPEDAVRYWSARYDRVAQVSPEASVALYSLGDPELLNAATAEVVSFLRGLHLLGPHCRLLDLGCGIGRMLPALAAEVGSVTGIDISAEMVERAKRRCQSLSNVTIRRCSGLDLTEFPEARFDLVLAADVLPYVFEAGPQLVNDIVREMTRVLVPNGTMVLLNFSYRADHADADRCDISHLAHSIQLDVVQNGSQPFKLWDATAFVLKKRDPVRVDRATH